MDRQTDKVSFSATLTHTTHIQTYTPTKSHTIIDTVTVTHRQSDTHSHTQSDRHTHTHSLFNTDRNSEVALKESTHPNGS